MEPDETLDSHATWRRTLDSLLQGFQIIGFDWSYVYVNPAAARHGQRTVAELVGKKMWEAYPGIEHSPLFVELKRVMVERVASSLENRFTFADGTPRWFELHIEPVPDGICVHSVDVEDRKVAQASLEQLNAELETQVRARTHELQLANRELEAFSYSVSHDLRTPLRALDGFARALADDYAERLEGRGLDYLSRIRKASQRMDKLIRDLLQLAQITRTTVVRQQVDLSQMAHDVMDELRASETNRKAEVSVEPGLMAACDPSLARVVLHNLLDNALKFSARSAHPCIQFARSPDAPRTFVVRDNGVGFDMQYAHKLFTPFQRLHGPDDFPGTGVGLATVQRIVRKHGGEVRVSSALGEGTRVSFGFEGVLP